MTNILRLAHSLFPATTRNITAKVIHQYLDKAEPIAETSGNLFAPARFGTSIHGGWNSDADYDIRKKNAIRSLVFAGIAAGLVVLAKRQLTTR
jgi:hypothetical protein